MLKKTRLALIAALGAAAMLTLASCSTTPTVNENPAPAEEIEEVVEVEPEAAETVVGASRENPAPLGAEITDGDWTVVINSVNPDATAQIMAANEFNDAPKEGNVYILVNATVTYNGGDPQGETPWAIIDYITPEGNTIGLSYVSYEEEDFTLLDTLYAGASHTGSNAYEVPAATATDGILAVTPSMTSDKAFVSLK